MNLYILMILATLASTARVFILIGLSIVTGWLFGYISIKSKIFENIYISLNEVLESVPVITFFPVVLIFFIYHIGGFLGVELAADFLVFTAIVWNIWMGIYQAFKTIPLPMLEEVENLRMNFINKLRYLYIPFSVPRIAANLIPSFSDAFFYITVSEVFIIGTTSYTTFGIGSVIVYLTSNGLLHYVYYALLFLGIIIGISIYLLREFARYAVAKYSLDSEIPISRSRIRQRYLARFYTPLTSPARRLGTLTSRYISTPMKRVVRIRKLEEERNENPIILRVVGAIIGISILGILIYSVYSIISSVTYKEWTYLISNTLIILIGLLYDYIRVAIIALVSFVIAISLAYYIALHKMAESVLIPLIQIIAAYPAPVYFPLLFTITYGIIAKLLGYFSIEFFVILLGFLSTFYYIFYAFWLGVKAIPQEIWELMDNLDMNYFEKMRFIILPATLPYIISGLTSTINSAWGGLMIGEYWPDIINGHSLSVKHGLMRLLDEWTYQGNIALASYASLIFSVVVVIFAIVFTRHMMNLAREKYVVEEGIYAA
ncbi:MAG: sugar ABC transporter permease [Caldisphaera sp.]|nr:MAG: sugar ABC transporter permease [Caldisphaera sp.]